MQYFDAATQTWSDVYFYLFNDLLLWASPKCVPLPLPAPVVGMVLLLLALMFSVPYSDRVADASGALIRHISLLIFPLGVGIVLQWERYSDYALALTVAVIFGTILALVLVTLLLKLLLRERGKAGQRGGRADG